MTEQNLNFLLIPRAVKLDRFSSDSHVSSAEQSRDSPALLPSGQFDV